MNPQPPADPPQRGPLPLCTCILHESTHEIRRLLSRIDALANQSRLLEAQRELKRSLALVEESVRLHVAEYMPQYARNMVELSKVNALNALPVQTSVWKGGDERKIREPTKKKHKTGSGAVAGVSGKTVVVLEKEVKKE